MTLLTLTVALSLCAAPPKKGGSNETMKGLVKDAVAIPPAASQDGGAAAAPKGDGPDVSSLPFTPASIKQVVTYYGPRIQGCYEETLAAKTKAVEGTLMTSFTITPEGLVKKPVVVKKGTTIKDPKLHECVVAVIGTMAFPKPSDGKDHPIEYPFNLKAIE